MFGESEGHIMDDVKRELFMIPAQSQTPGMLGNSMRENRETPCAARGRKAAGRWEKAMSDKTHMHGGGESYSGVVPAKQPNKGGRPSAEVVEGRPLAKENAEQSNQRRRQSRESGTSGLDRVREAAKKDRKLRFPALLHHVSDDQRERRSATG